MYENDMNVYILYVVCLNKLYYFFFLELLRFLIEVERL